MNDKLIIAFLFLFLASCSSIDNKTIGNTLGAAAGGVIGAQIGTRLGVYLKAEQLRILLALLVLVVCIKLGLELIAEPSELFSLQEMIK